MLFPQGHICHQSVRDVCDISQSVFAELGLQVLFYGEILKDKEGFLFYTDDSFFKERFSLSVPLAGTFLEDGFYTWEDTQPSDLILLANQHQYHHPINIVIRHGNVKRIITLAYSGKVPAVSSQNRTLSNYVNQKEHLLACCYQFMDMMGTLCHNARKDAVSIPEHLVHPGPPQSAQPSLHSMRLEPMVWIKAALGQILSEREIEVFVCVLMGQSSKQIAQVIGVNIKTVDTYIARIKSKLSLSSRSDIIKFAWDKDIIKFVLPA